MLEATREKGTDFFVLRRQLESLGLTIDPATAVFEKSGTTTIMWASGDGVRCLILKNENKGLYSVIFLESPKSIEQGTFADLDKDTLVERLRQQLEK